MASLAPWADKGEGRSKRLWDIGPCFEFARPTLKMKIHLKVDVYTEKADGRIQTGSDRHGRSQVQPP